METEIAAGIAERIDPARTAARARLVRPEHVLSAAFLLVTLAVWEALTRGGMIHEIILPAPTRIAAGIWTVITLDGFPRELGTTLLEVLLGFLLAAAGGIGIGILTGTFELFRRAIYPYVVAFQVIPKVVFAPDLPRLVRLRHRVEGRPRRRDRLLSVPHQHRGRPALHLGRTR